MTDNGLIDEAIINILEASSQINDLYVSGAKLAGVKFESAINNLAVANARLRVAHREQKSLKGVAK